MKFVCDQMLGELGKWLRCAGYDTLIIQAGQKDSDILHLALKEKRFLLSRDKHFTQMKEAEPILVYSTENSMESWAKELKKRLKISWVYKPFTRCLLCNHLLEVSPDRRDAPPDVTGTIWHCPECQKSYWMGSHTDRMLNQLKAWDQLNS